MAPLEIKPYLVHKLCALMTLCNVILRMFSNLVCRWRDKSFHRLFLSLQVADEAII